MVGKCHEAESYECDGVNPETKGKLKYVLDEKEEIMVCPSPDMPRNLLALLAGKSYLGRCKFTG